MFQIKKSVGNFFKTIKVLDSGPKCAAKFRKIAKRAMVAKSLKTTGIYEKN